jgi:pyruvate formate lyase activating enzyme
MESVPPPRRHLESVTAQAGRLQVSGRVFNIQRFAVHDGPGVRTTVFLKGCPLSCWWCHNPESRTAQPEVQITAERCIQCGSCLQACEHDAVVRLADGTYSVDPLHCTRCGECTEACPTNGRKIVGEERGVDDVLDEVCLDRVFYEESGGGVTFSGGEPLAQRDFLLELLTESRARGLHTCVDTSGAAPEKTVLRVAEVADLFLYDVKMIDDTRHRLFTGAGNRTILSNLQALARRGADVWVRVPFIPGINDDRANLDALAAFVGELGRDYPVFLLPYHKIAQDKYGRLGHDYPLAGLEPPGEEQVAAAAERLRHAGLRVNIGG